MTSRCTNEIATNSALLVHSGAAIDELLERALTSAGWSIQHVADNEDVLAAARKHPADLIITSRKTRGPEDIELLREVRSVRPHGA